MDDGHFGRRAYLLKGSNLNFFTFRPCVSGVSLKKVKKFRFDPYLSSPRGSAFKILT